MIAPDSQLVEILRRTRTLLIDFDGPICSVFAGYPATVVADELRRLITAHGGEVELDLDTDEGPISVLRRVANTGPAALVRTVADALRDAEVRAVETADPTPGAGDVLRAAQAAGRRVAVVSNNSREAVRRYLDRRGLSALVDGISARYDGMDPRFMKPNDHLIRRAIDALSAEPATTTLVGDSAADAKAGTSAGVCIIGYANKPGKRDSMNAAGAQVVVDSLPILQTALVALDDV